MNIIPAIDSSVPGWLRTTIDSVVRIFDRHFANRINVRIEFDFQSFQALRAPSASGKSVPNYGYQSYGDLKAALAQGSAASRYAAASMPAGDPTPQGGTGDVFKVPFALEKALGLQDPSIDPRLNDGTVTLNSDKGWMTDPAADPTQSFDTIGDLEHEISEILGRIGILGKSDGYGNTLYGPMDLFRFDRRSKTVRRDFSPVTGSYFSLRGNSAIERFNNLGGDLADWSYTGPHAVSQDAFGSTTLGQQVYFSNNDLTAMRGLGYEVSNAIVTGSASYPSRIVSSRVFAPQAAPSTFGSVAGNPDASSALGLLAYGHAPGADVGQPRFVFQPHPGQQAAGREPAVPGLSPSEFASVVDMLRDPHSVQPGASAVTGPANSTIVASLGADPSHHHPHHLAAHHLA